VDQTRSVLRVGNFSGFYGDRAAAAQQMLDGGPLDFLTGDYLAELTMMILYKARRKDPAKGYATTFLSQLEGIFAKVVERKVRVVVNAGGLNPRGLARDVREVARRLGVQASVVAISGDDLLGDLADLQRAGTSLAHLDTGQRLADAGVTPVTANVYLGAWPIVAALRRGADIVICPRVADASLVVGPAAWHFGWAVDDWDALAGAAVAGHVLECGTQATGGNYAFFTEITGLEQPGFPIAEMHADGSSVITKHPHTGGAVTVETVTAQLLYEIAAPAYLTPDVVARFDTAALSQDGPDRVRIAGTRGEPAPANLKLGINYAGGYRNSATFFVAGLDLDAKAALIERSVRATLAGREPAHLEFLRGPQPAAQGGSIEESSTTLRVEAKDSNADLVGRRFTNAIVEMALGSYPGLHLAAPPSPAKDYAVYWPTLVPRSAVTVALDGGWGDDVVLGDALAGRGQVPGPVPADAAGAGPPAGTERGTGEPPGANSSVVVALGLIAGARSGDKGGNANIGVWARDESGFGWLHEHLTPDRVQQLLPELAGYRVERFVLANLRSLNFVVYGLLGEGVASSTRFDPQAKSLGEVLRSRLVSLPRELVASRRESRAGVRRGSDQPVCGSGGNC
jgi:Acyclic terpene utilisation family protein AtuA